MIKQAVRAYGRRYIVGFLLGLILLATACADQLTSEETVPAAPTLTPAATPTGRGIGDTLELYYWQAPSMLNPHLTTNLKDWDAARITYEPLASFDQDGNLIPFLAADIPSLENGGVAEDGQSVTWRLKKDVQWSDGAPFTAEDVRFTYEYISNPAVQSDSSPAYEAVAEVEIIDPHTVKVHFKEVNPAWSLPFVGVRGAILPRHIFEPYNGPAAQEAPPNLMPVGTGPYRAVKFQTEAFLILNNELVETKKIVYEPNPYYREEDKPFFSRVELKGGGDAEEAAYSVLEIGDVDFAWNLQIDAGDLERLEALGKGKVIAISGPRIERILLNRSDPHTAVDGYRSHPDSTNPRLSDPKVRQALTYVLNREEIAALSGPADQATSNNLVSPARYNSPNTSYEFNLDKAATLLDEAGWTDSDNDGIRDKDGIELSLTFQTTINPLRQQIQNRARRNLADIGVEVELEVIDASIFFGSDTSNPDHYRRFQADMQVYREGNQSPDPGAYMKFWTCDQIPRPENNWTGENVERWCNPDYDALYEQSTREIDPDRRQQLFIQMNDMLIEDVVMIPLANRAQVNGVSHNLTGLDPTPWDAATWNIQDWRRD